MPESMTGKKIALILCLFLSVSVAIAALWRTLLPEKYFLSVAAIMKNEKPYLKEWLEYHRLQGVEHFYLCDNGSTDGTKDYLQPYIQSGVITYIDFPGTNRQLACYDKIVKEYGRETTWLALIDLDEFLLPLQAKDMPSFLKEFADVNEVSLHWLNYGDNGLISRPGGLVTEAFTAHARFLNHTVKSIVRPEAVRRMSGFGDNHYVPVAGKSVNEKPLPFRGQTEPRLLFRETKKERHDVSRVFLRGGDNRTRICDLSRVRRALYQLSYASIWETLVTRTGIEPVLPP